MAKIDLKKSLVVVAVVAVIVLMVVVEVLNVSQPPDPLAQFITHRQCSFIEFGDLHAAACTDGTQWTVGPFP